MSIQFLSTQFKSVSKAIISITIGLLAYSGSISADVPANVQAVFESYGCNAAGCHSGGAPDAGLGLDNATISEMELVDVDSELGGCVLKRVDPGDPANSTLYDKIANANPICGARMPLGGPNVNDADLATIFNWVVSLGAAEQFGRIELEAATATAQETDPSITIMVNRAQGIEGQITVDYTVSAIGADNASSPDDFVADANTLTFDQGVTSQPITVTLADDDVFEGAEVFSVSISNVLGGAVLGAQTLTKVTIVDNEVENLPGTFFFNAVNYSVNENAGTLDLTVLRSFGGLGDVTVNLSAIAGSASEGADFESFNQTLVFPEATQSMNVSINIVDDQEQEGNENFSLRLSNPTGGSEIGAPSTVNIAINDDESNTGGDDDGGDDGGDDGSGDGDNGDQQGGFETPPEEEFEAAGSLFWILPLLLTSLFFRQRRNKSIS